ncbi:MAG: amidase, hydantoinase/carbamoylase family [Chloroflexi bacterium OLB15]|nr:MAG: amidase, hydantoinase/carbamoylase family [Chloroflexi bacterium OLB15]
MMLNPQRTIDELKELRAITGNDDGAQRVAWTETWATARDWLHEKLSNLPVTLERDEAGNDWATLKGASEKELLIGGHMDSVPNGGWLDGCLNVLAGLEVLRRIASEGTPPVTVRLVDWADEEGARFGRSLVGSSACSGTIDPQSEIAHLKDKDGIALPDALAKFNVHLDTMKQSHRMLKNAKAYLELHIEQGPVLESMDLPLGAVIGTYGVERNAIHFIGQAAHAGSTPMDKRKDAFAAAAKLGLEIRPIAVRHHGVCTVGRVTTRPGIVTAVVGECDMTLDQRNMDANELAAMLQEAVAASERFAAEEKCEVSWERIWQIQPIPFDPHLIDLCDEAIKETVGVSHRLPSGPLHDAPEMQRAGVPTVMMFVQSLRGISHNKIEDTKEEHIALSVQALDRLATKTIDWILSQ